MTKTQAMTAMLVAEMAKGFTATQALRNICGDAMVDQMIDTLYHELRAKAGAK